MSLKSPRAYSYLRFSTPEQLKGDSLRRQAKLADDYAETHGLTLDTELNLRDLGVSAFRGDNAATGALGAFLKAVRDRLVPKGSFFLVESLDRVSRTQARKAVRILEEIVEAGVTLVTLNDGKQYTDESLNGTDFLIAILIMMRSHEESATKAKRLKAAWVGKRQRAQTREVQTTRVPGWIHAEGSGAKNARNATLSLIDDRAALVRRMFDMYLNGNGKDRIAKAFNAEGIPTWGAGVGRRPATQWHSSYVIKILTSPTTYGTLTPHVDEYDVSGKHLRVAQEPVEFYYPAAVDRDTFTRVQGLISGKRRSSSGRGVVSLVAGLARCPKCGSTMTRITKGRTGGPPRLGCVLAKNEAGCVYRLVRLADVESAIIGNVHVLATPPLADGGLADEIKSAEAALDGVIEQIESLIDAIEQLPSAALSKRLEAREQVAEKLRESLRSLHERAKQTESSILKLRAKRLSDALQWYGTQPLGVAQANAAMRECFDSIVVDYVEGTLRLKWRQGAITELPYAMGDEAARP